MKIFKYIKDKIKVETTEEEIKINVPNIKFNDLDLLHKIMEWVEEPVSVYDGFGKVLKELGYSEDDEVSFSDFDIKTMSFYATSKLNKSRNKISVRYGDWLDFFPEVMIENDKNMKRYEYRYNKNTGLNMHLVGYKNKLDNGNTFSRQLLETSIVMFLENGEYELAINISNDGDFNLNEEYRIMNDEKLEEYIKSLTFPINIVEVYKHISELSIEEKHHKVLLEVRKYSGRIKDDKNKEVVDRIELHDGNLFSFIITRNNKTIELNNNTWTLKSDDLVISKDDNGKVSYSASSNIDNVEEMISPKEQILSAKEDVEEVIKLSKTLF